MLQLPGDLRLLDEAADHFGVVAQVVAQHLDRQVAPEVQVAPLSTTPMPPRAISPRNCNRPGPPVVRGISVEPDTSSGPDGSSGPASRSNTRGTGPIVPSIESSTPGSFAPDAASWACDGSGHEASRVSPARPASSRQRGQMSCAAPDGRSNPQIGQLSRSDTAAASVHGRMRILRNGGPNFQYRAPRHE